jgi:hypothetical protein
MADNDQMQVDGDEAKGQQQGEEYEEIREQVCLFPRKEEHDGGGSVIALWAGK